MISIIITSFNEPNLEMVIKSVLTQKINYEHEIMVVAPDKNAQNLAKKYKIKYFKDKGKGKSSAINLLLKKIKSKILILTDGDVYLEKNSINEILELFKDNKIGCVSGRPVSINSKNTKFGYWSHLLTDAGAHRIRKLLFVSLLLLLPSILSKKLIDLNNLILFEPVIIFVISFGIIKLLQWQRSHKLLLLISIILVLGQYLITIYDISYREYPRYGRFFGDKLEISQK